LIFISGCDGYVIKREDDLSTTEIFSEYVTFIDDGLSLTALNHKALSVTFQSLFDSTRNVKYPASGEAILIVSPDLIILLSVP